MKTKEKYRMFRMFFVHYFCSHLLIVVGHYPTGIFSKFVSLIMYYLWNYHSAGTSHNLSFRGWPETIRQTHLLNSINMLSHKCMLVFFLVECISFTSIHNNNFKAKSTINPRMIPKNFGIYIIKYYFIISPMKNCYIELQIAQ